MAHYYSPNPNSPSNPFQIAVHVREQAVRLTVDSGVFSKRGLDYGTRVLLETVTFARPVTAVDLGCGYGPVTAVLSRIYRDSRWVMIDVNPRAVELARLNTTDLGDRVDVYQSDGFATVPPAMFDEILLNPPIRAGKAVVYNLFLQARERLVPDGHLWIVMHKKHGAQSALRYLSAHFALVELMNREAGYHVLRCSIAP